MRDRTDATLQPPCAYQGGKAHLADQIAALLPPDGERYYDLCCGSGAVSIALRRRGVPASRLTLVDRGP